jgi:CBS domain-containing protein/beta-phosphoglucomutase-like phosphatase (HAD superfamily)
MTKKLRASRQSGDTGALLEAMHRRLTTVWNEYLDNGSIVVRPGVRELVCAAQRDGIGLAVVSTLPHHEALRLLKATLGLEAPQLFKSVASAHHDIPARSEEYLYRAALRDLGLEPDNCLAIEATDRGLAAATAAEVPCIVSRSLTTFNDGLDDAVFVINELTDLLSSVDTASLRPHGPSCGEEILSILHRLHAGTFDVFGLAQRSFVMKVSDILKDKGAAVKTIRASETILALSQKLRNEKVGAMVVTSPDGTLEGIISERDIANGLAVHAAALGNLRVSDLMTKAVVTCSTEDSISSVAKVMTQRRFRHLPVQQDGQLVGLISIGDVLKHRLDELQFETRVLRDVLIARS